MKLTATVTDLMRNFADYVNRVAYRGEHFVLLRGGRPVAELSPTPVGGRLRDLPQLMGSLPQLEAREAAMWGEELEAARADLEMLPPEDAWES